MPGRPWTRSQLLELRRLHNEGQTARQIAVALDRTPEAIRTLRGTLGLRFYVKVSPEERAQIEELHAAGVRDVDIAGQLDRAVTTVRKILGIHLAVKKPWTGAETKKLYRLRREGKTYPEIGKLMGRSPHACVMRFVNWEKVRKKREADRKRRARA
jgi:DNA-binding CsgD family transcriptional regulator